MKRTLRLSVIAGGFAAAAALACLAPNPHGQAYAQATVVYYNGYGQGYYGGNNQGYYNGYGRGYGGTYVFVPNRYTGFGNGPYGTDYYPVYSNPGYYDPFYGRPVAPYGSPAFGYYNRRF
jgi:hypothetical protein